MYLMIDNHQIFRQKVQFDTAWSRWWKISLGSGNALVLSGKKPFHDPLSNSFTPYAVNSATDLIGLRKLYCPT